LQAPFVVTLWLIVVLVAVVTAAGFWLGRRRALATTSGDLGALHSLPGYYGWYAALWCGIPGLVVAILWAATASWSLDQLTLAGLPPSVAGESEARVTLFLNDVRNLASGNIASERGDAALVAAADRYRSLRANGLMLALALALAVSVAGGARALLAIRPGLAARVRVERILRMLLLVSSTIAVLVTVGIVLSLIFETVRFFRLVSLDEFLFGLHWSPQTALRADQVGSSGSFGAVPVFAGTALITAIAMLVAVPVGLMAAVYMTFYADSRIRAVAKPVLEILAGIPTVVYGFFAALVIAPLVRGWGATLGLDVASESALAAGLVMGVMIIPFISSLSDDAITAVPDALREGSFGLGATRAETIRYVVLPAALPGIVGAFLLAISRAVGETMIVVMAAGLAANLTLNPLQAVTTVTVQIVTLLTGDQEFDSAKTLAAFALGLVLFVVTLILNLAALRVVHRFRERYD
jgi:phosphate transport system permease protein